MYSFFHAKQRVKVKQKVGGPFAGRPGTIRNYLGMRTILVKGEGAKSFQYYEIELDGGKGLHRFADEELELE